MITLIASCTSLVSRYFVILTHLTVYLADCAGCQAQFRVEGQCHPVSSCPAGVRKNVDVNFVLVPALVLEVRRSIKDLPFPNSCLTPHVGIIDSQRLVVLWPRSMVPWQLDDILSQLPVNTDLVEFLNSTAPQAPGTHLPNMSMMCPTRLLQQCCAGTLPGLC